MSPHYLRPCCCKSAFNPPVIELGTSARLERGRGTACAQIRRWNEARHATQLRPAAAVHGRGRGGAAPASCVSRHAGPHALRTCHAFGWEGGGPTFVGTPTEAHRAPKGGGEVADEYEPVVRCVESARPSLLVINLFALGPAAARACSSGVACGQTTRCSSGTTLLFSHEARARGAALASRHAGTHALRTSA